MNKIITILIQIIIGFFLADLAAGIGHWLEDTYFHYCLDYPILKSIAKANELHHFFPRDITHYTYIENMTVTLPLTILSILFIILIRPNFVLNYPFMFISFFIFSSLSNMIHRFSHERNCERHSFITYLQKQKIFVSPEQHKKHHEQPNCNFCVISPLSNYILESIYFWRLLEIIIYQLFGILPHGKLRYNDYSDLHIDIHHNSKEECPRKVKSTDIDELFSILDNKYKCYKYNNS